MKKTSGIDKFLIIWIVLGIIMFNLPNKAEEQVKTKENLFIGQSGNNLNIKTTLTKSSDKEIITTQKVLKNVQWAQLRLYPTIGCTHPTLFYLADNNQQVQRIEVDEATIVE